MFLMLAFPMTSQASPSPSPSSVSFRNESDSSSIFAFERTLILRIVAATCSAVSIVASFITFYWFCRMRKRFRHRLIMLLMYGDFMRSSWLFIYAIVSLALGTVRTDSAFCQASGFLYHYGTETSDYAVLVIAVHSAIQVFRPSSPTHSEGLYPYRYYVITLGLLIPVTMSALAFVNPHWGYTSQGAFCSLPLRPFWYRLALAWIPRYMIAIIILGLAVAIYTHFGWEFRAIANNTNEMGPSFSTATPIASMAVTEEGRLPMDSESPEWLSNTTESCNPATIREADGNRPVSTTSLGVMIGSENTSMGQAIRSSSTATDLSNSTAFDERPANISRSSLNHEVPTSREPSPLFTCPSTPIHNQVNRDRAQAYRSLRLMFIYPLAYTIMWVIPFVGHCMTYQDKWAVRPLYWISVLTVMSITLMGAVDGLIFSLREHPWRHIPTSDGTFLNSFLVWRACACSKESNEADEDGAGAVPSRSTTHQGAPLHSTSHSARQTTNRSETDFAPSPDEPRESVSPYSRSVARRSVRTSGGSSDNARAAADMAHLRLELEKEDRRMAVRRIRDLNARRMSIAEDEDEDDDDESGVL